MITDIGKPPRPFKYTIDHMEPPRETRTRTHMYDNYMIKHVLLSPAMALCMLLAACGVSPLQPDNLQQAELRAIQQAYAETIRQARADHTSSWHSGPLGNLWVNYWGEPNYGLCYQWQRLVYEGVHQRVEQLGWQASGIHINKGTDHEHHAVVVFDPGRTPREQLLERPGSAGAYVLDPWRSGQADIYSLSDWLQLPRVVEVPAQLKELKPAMAH